MQGRTIGQTTTIDVGIGINHITRWLDDECYAGLFELGLNISPPTLLPILSAALGGRFQQHDRLPPASTSELQKQWWALAAHQQMSHLDGTIQHGGLDDFSQTFEQDDSKQQALAGFSNTERFDQQKKVENVNPANNRENDRGKQHNRTAGHPTITNSETVEAKQHRQGSQLGEREDTGEKDFDCEIQEPRVGTNESSATRIIGTDKNGGLIILNSINKIVLYESF
jgi:hypothetical protein